MALLIQRLAEALEGNFAFQWCQRRRRSLETAASSALAKVAGTSRRGSCYYDVLGISDRKCDAADIKTAYKKLALKMHPDKAQVNGLTEEDATRRFQQIQEAYRVLSDAQERAWYDAHREKILKGDDEPVEEPGKSSINLYRYFSSNCYDGFGDDLGGFYAVYAFVFSTIDGEEAEWEDLEEDGEEEHESLPPFGDARSEWSDVGAFYRRWAEFYSRKGFSHACKYDTSEAESRQERRQQEAENKKLRQTARRDFNAEVRQLVKFVQKRDPRVAAHQEQQAVEKEARELREAEENERRRVENERLRQERREAQRLEDEARWAELKEARRANGEKVSDEEDEGGSSGGNDVEVLQFRCEPCRKSFKSEKMYEQHVKTKKHLQVVKQRKA